MRIALTHPRADRRGGIERVVVECANHLAGRGHDVRIYATRWDASELDAAVRIAPVPTRARPDALAAVQYRSRATRALARDAAATDVHASFGALSPLGGVYWIPSVHRVAYELALSRRRGAARRLQQANPFHRLRLRFEAELYAPGGSARLLAAAETVKADVIEHYGVPAERIDVLPLGYTPDSFGPERRAELRGEARAARGYSDQHRVVCFVANELERKGFDTLLRAVARLEDPSVRLLVVGAADATSYRDEIVRLGLAGRVDFTGPVADVAACHAAADVFALPTRYEPWGLVIVEALASGLPVLTSRLAGASVAVRPGENGLLLEDPDDVEETAAGLRSLLDTAPAGPREIAASVRWLSWPEIISRYEEVLVAASKETG